MTRPCVTHHFACDCREEAVATLITKASRLSLWLDVLAEDYPDAEEDVAEFEDAVLALVTLKGEEES